MRQVTVGAVIGTVIEWYDYLLYGTAEATVFNKVFFPGISPTASTLAAFSTFAVGFVVRPVGAAVFGQIGDRVSRKAALLITLFLVGGGTFLIGALPGYHQIGVAAPVPLAASVSCRVSASAASGVAPRC